MEEIRFGDIKKMDYNDNLPFKYVTAALFAKIETFSFASGNYIR